MTKTKKQFAQEVKEELNHIKLHATQEELSRLHFEYFRHDSSFNCIYGQMTGSCKSKRALEIMPKRYIYVGDPESDDRFLFLPFKEHSFIEFSTPRYHGYTPLEKYLFMVGPDVHERIIKYLKGEINKFNVVIP